MRVSRETLTVVVAFVANLGVAVAKTVVAALTGSASMAAEAAHSWADTGNQVFLLVADHKARRPPDQSHPMGYGREAYVWSLFAAMGLFTAGGVVSIYHGVTELRSEVPVADYALGYVVLAIAFCLEAGSFLQALRRARREAADLGREVLDHALLTSDPTLRAVLAEDSAALVGVLVATAGLMLHQLTGEAWYDAAGSILIGILLCAVGVLLIDRNRRFLTGQAVEPPVHRAAVRRVQELDGVERVTRLRVEYVGPRQVLLVGSVGLDGDARESDVARTLRRLSDELERDPSVVEAVLTLALPEDAADLASDGGPVRDARTLGPG